MRGSAKAILSIGEDETMITREFLAQYTYLESEIKRMKRRIKYYKEHPLMASHGVVKGSMKDFPYVQCHYVVSVPSVKSDEERKKAISQLLVDLEGNCRLFEDMQLEIELFIESLTDLEERTIFSLYYIEKMKMDEIGRGLGYDRSTISKKIDRVLERNEQLSHNSHS